MRKTHMFFEFGEMYENINKIYETELKILQKICKFELRKQKKKLAISFLIIFEISILIVIKILAIIKSEILGGFIFLLLILINAGVWIYYTGKIKCILNEYQYRYINLIIQNFVKMINSRYTYIRGKNDKLKKAYREAEFKKGDYNCNRFETINCISGEINGEFVELCDIYRLVQSTPRSGTLIPKYIGLFSYSEINKKISHEIRIRNNKKKGIMQHMQVELNNKEFEKYFDTFSNSQILANKILTNDIMKELIHFYKKNGIELQIIILENKIYIEYDVANIFEGSTTFNKEIDMNKLWFCKSILNFVINLTEKINKVLD